MDSNELKMTLSLANDDNAALLTEEDGDVMAHLEQLVETWKNEGKKLVLVATTFGNMSRMVHVTTVPIMGHVFSDGVELVGLKMSGNIIVAPVPPNVLKCAAALKKRDKSAEKMTIERLEQLGLLSE